MRIGMSLNYAGGFAETVTELADYEKAGLDILFAFPGILLAVLAAAIFGAGLTAASIALMIAYMPYVARVLRGAALKERGQPYVAAL